MALPKWLKEALELELNRMGSSQVAQAYEELSDTYRQATPANSTYITNRSHRSAYLAARFPATFASITRVLQEVKLRLPDLQISSILDIGSGPGTATFAALEIFPEIKQISLLEKDSELIKSGKNISTKNSHPALKQAQWISQDLNLLSMVKPHDLIICSYSLGELQEKMQEKLLKICWEGTTKILAVIEPGTPKGFEKIRSMRSQLISFSSHLVAPCPHMEACPMKNGNWCHFSIRLERSSFHRQVKGGSLGYEDEKYSYVAVSKQPCTLPQSRVLRHPKKRSGHVHLNLCTKKGLSDEIVSKKTPEVYKTARYVEWGDSFNDSCGPFS